MIQLLPKDLFSGQAWFSNIRADVLSGAVVALALIPEAIAFSIIAGVDPTVGLYASFCIAIVTSIFGGRPAMISAATGAMALVITPLVKSHGLDYLLAATILTGVFQIIWGFIRLGNQLKFVPRAVMIGFVNALAILIFDAQLPQLEGENFRLPIYIMMAVGLAIIYGVPRITKLVPSPLVAIVVVTGASMALGIEAPTVGSQGALPDSLPPFLIPNVPWTWDTFNVIAPYSLALSFVGLLESFLTANVLDDFTDTASDKNQEAKAQGYANILAGFFGGMAGCAMIGQSVINVTSGGRTRFSTLCAGIFLLTFILVGGEWVAQIPMAVLVAVMFMVSFSTFSWASLKNIRLVPHSETAVMITTVLATVLTHNLAIGVLLGVALSAIFFARKVAELVTVDSVLDESAMLRTYTVSGSLFFVSVESFLDAFQFREDVQKVVIDLTHSHIWDQSAVDAVDKTVLRFRRRNVAVDLVGMNQASATLIERLAIHDKPGALDQVPGH